MPDNDHANAANEQVRQARDNGTIPESRPEYSSIRLVVDGEKLNANNPIDLLVMKLLRGKRYEGHYDGDETEVAKWAIASWCQEIGWAPDLTDYDVGEQVDLGDEVPYLDAAFYDHEHVDDVQEDDGTEGLGELVDGHERGVIAIIREGIEQHRGNVCDDNVPMTKDELGAAADLEKAVKEAIQEDEND